MQISFPGCPRSSGLTWLDTFMVQEALYWDIPDRDGYGGYTWKTPVVIKARWEYERRVVYSPDGSEILSDISVWVPFNVNVGGYLYEGNYASFGLVSMQNTAPDDVMTGEIQDRALQVVAMDKIFSLARKSTVYYKATLQKYGISKRL